MKKGDKVKIKNYEGTGLGHSSKAKIGIVRCIHRIDAGNHLSIVLRIGNSLYGFNESNLEHI